MNKAKAFFPHRTILSATRNNNIADFPNFQTHYQDSYSFLDFTLISTSGISSNSTRCSFLLITVRNALAHRGNLIFDSGAVSPWQLARQRIKRKKKEKRKERERERKDGEQRYTLLKRNERDEGDGKELHGTRNVCKRLLSKVRHSTSRAATGAAQK